MLGIGFVYTLQPKCRVHFCLRKYISSLNGNTIPKEISVQYKHLPNSKKDEFVKKRKVTYNLKHYEQISEYIASNKCSKEIKDKIPAIYMMKKFETPNRLYLIDNGVARGLFQTLKPHLESYNGHILEVNAGAGILTTHLLMSNLPRLRIYESDSCLYNDLYELIQKTKSDARLFKENLLMICRMIKLDREDHENRVAAAFDGVSTLPWEDEPVMKLIVAVSIEHFILHLLYSIIFQSGICVYGRPQLFVIMPSNIFFKLTATPDQGYRQYRSKSVLFQLLFEHIILKQVPEKAFVPWMNKKSKKQTKDVDEIKEDNDVMYLVKMTARKDLFQRVPYHLIKPLWFFVQLVMHKRKSKLIAVLEKWIPGCGVKLIARGYTIYTECGSIAPEEYLQIFLEFSSLPEFTSCSFLPAMESLVVRMTDPGICEEIITESKTKDINKELNVEGHMLDLADDRLKDFEQVTNKTMSEEEEVR